MLGQVQRSLQAYVTTMVPSWADADEVLQNTNITLWRKFKNYEPGTSFLAWSRAIALIECKRFRQAAGRDRMIFSEKLMEALTETVDRESDRLAAEREALQACLRKLPNDDQTLIQRCYHGQEKIASISHDWQLSAGTLYVRLHRIRRALLTCITRRIAKEGV